MFFDEARTRGKKEGFSIIEASLKLTWAFSLFVDSYEDV